eukprot:2470062-Rhodomonas_salina.1
MTIFGTASSRIALRVCRNGHSLFEPTWRTGGGETRTSDRKSPELRHSGVDAQPVRSNNLSAFFCVFRACCNCRSLFFCCARLQEEGLQDRKGPAQLHQQARPAAARGLGQVASPPRALCIRRKNAGAHVSCAARRLRKIRCNRGLRHAWGFKVRGQHTKSTGRGHRVRVACSVSICARAPSPQCLFTLCCRWLRATLHAVDGCAQWCGCVEIDATRCAADGGRGQEARQEVERVGFGVCAQAAAPTPPRTCYPIWVSAYPSLHATPHRDCANEPPARLPSPTLSLSTATALRLAYLLFKAAVVLALSASGRVVQEQTGFDQLTAEQSRDPLLLLPSLNAAGFELSLAEEG